MRELKFRGLNDNGNMVQGFLSMNYEFEHVISMPYEHNPTMNDPCGGVAMDYNIVSDVSIGQFTGIKDKNGVDVYEGDVVKVLFTDWASQSDSDKRSLEEYLDHLTRVFTVEFHSSAFTISCDSYYVKGEKVHADLWCGKHGYIEVIGNIHQNPELACTKK